ncbi:transposase family protein [Paraburkholderia sediminicola]|uniref:transposase family protein n=1 Tax=Paraburkholderia sediminicola TaxID=458836 RepID=UPI0038BD05B0
MEEAFGVLRDPHSRTTLHNLIEVLLVAPCTLLSGADSWLASQYWSEAKLEWLGRAPGKWHSVTRHRWPHRCRTRFTTVRGLLSLWSATFAPHWYSRWWPSTERPCVSQFAARRPLSTWCRPMPQAW